MARGEKYIGKIYEGRWRVERFENYAGLNKSNAGRFVLVNIYNGEERRLKDQTLRRIDRGEVSLSWVFAQKVKRVRRMERIKGKFNWNQDY